MAMLMRVGWTPYQPDPEQPEPFWLPPGKGEYKVVTGKPEDYPDYDAYVHHRGTSREVTVLVPRPSIVVAPSTFEPDGLVESPCAHGLPQHPDGRPFRRGGRSWMRSHWIEIQIVQVTLGVSSARSRCPVCNGEVMNDPLWPLLREDKPVDKEAEEDGAWEAAREIFQEDLA